MSWYVTSQSFDTSIENVIIKGNPKDPSDDYFVRFFDSTVRSIITELIFKENVPYNINKMKLKKKIRDVINNFVFEEGSREGKKIKPWKWLISRDGRKSYKKIEKEVLKRYKTEAKSAINREKGIEPLPMPDQQEGGQPGYKGPPTGGIML